MNWQYSPYTLPLLSAVILSSVLALLGWRRRSTPGAVPFTFFMLAAVCWSFAYAMEIGVMPLSTKVFWAKVQYFGIVAAPVAWLFLTLGYLGKRQAFTVRNVLLSLAVPLLVLLAVWTNELHQWIWQDIRLQAIGPASRMGYTPGPLYLVNVIYAYAVFLTATLLLARAFVRMSHLYRLQTFALLIAALIPWGSNILFHTGWTPWPGLDLTPMAFTLTGVAALWGLFRFRLWDLGPVARDAVVTTMIDAVIVFDAQHRVVDLNPAAEALTGQAAAAIIGQPVTRVFPGQPDLIAFFDGSSEIQTELALGEAEARRDLDLRISPLRNQRGQITGRVLVLRDITQTKQVEQALRLSEERYILAARAAGIGIWDFLPSGAMYLDPPLKAMLGYAEDEITDAEQWAALNHPDDLPKVVMAFQAHIAGETDEYLNEQRMKHKDGSWRWMLGRGKVLRDAQGNYVRTVGVNLDITARKQAEEALQEANERLSILTSAHAELVSKLDAKYVLSLALDIAMRLSRADAGFIGLTEGDDHTVRIMQAIGDYPAAFFNGLLPPEATTTWQALRQHQTVLVKDVSIYPERVTVLPATQAQIVIPLIIRRRLFGVLQLETAQADHFTPDLLEFLELLASRTAQAIDNARLYQDQVLLAQELEAFAHTVAHDLKNPLSAIGGYTMLLQDEGIVPAEDQEQRQAYLGRIADITQRMNNIIEELMLLATVRKTDIRVSRLDMGSLVSRVLYRLEYMTHEYEADITISVEHWPNALGYAPWIEEVWVNYLSNAFKYGGQPPRVVLGADIQPGGAVRYWVQDNGAGLSPEEQARLFTPFTRLSQVNVEGHGLGLSIVQRIVTKLNGEVGVESAPGAGSTFYFILPGAADPV